MDGRMDGRTDGQADRTNKRGCVVLPQDVPSTLEKIWQPLGIGISSNSIESDWNSFKNAISESMDRNIPKRQLRVKQIPHG